MLEGFGLTEYGDNYAGGLSGGQRRLVEIIEPSWPSRPYYCSTNLWLACTQTWRTRLVTSSRACGQWHDHRDGRTRARNHGRILRPVIVLAEGQVLAQGTMSELRAKKEVVEAYLVGELSTTGQVLRATAVSAVTTDGPSCHEIDVKQCRARSCRLLVPTGRASQHC